MAAKKKPAAKKTAVKKGPVEGRCPTCGMAPCNVPADMRKTGKPKAKAAPRARKPKPEPEIGPVMVAAEIPLPDDPEQFDGDMVCDVCPLCDMPEDGCVCGIDDDDEGADV